MNSNTCELFHPDNMETARKRFKNKLVKDFSITGRELVKMALNAVKDPSNLTESEEIFHNSAMHYDPKRDAPEVKIKSFDEWRGKETKPVHLEDIQPMTVVEKEAAVINESAGSMLVENYGDATLVESKTDGEAVWVEGVFGTVNSKNKNGRIYPRAVMEQQIQKYNEEFTSRKRSLGELGHPKNPSINLELVSHLVTELKLVGNEIHGKAKIIDTPHGNIAKNLLNDGITLGVSLRGVGSVVNGVVQDNYKLLAVDLVNDPSAGSFVTAKKGG